MTRAQRALVCCAVLLAAPATARATKPRGRRAITVAPAPIAPVAPVAVAAPPVVAASSPYQLIALVEADYRAFSVEAEGYAGFALRRARMGLRARPLSWLELTFVGEYARTTVGILDAFATLRAGPTFEFNVGYLRVPTLPSGRDEQVFAMPVPEYSMTVAALWPGRDLGVEAHWYPRAPFELWARLGNGSGNPLGPEGNAATGALRADLVLGRASAHASRETPFGARVGAAAVVGSSSLDRTGIAGTTPLGFTFARATPVDGLRLTVTGHARLWAGPVRVTFEGGIARDSRSRDTDGDPRTAREPLDPVHTAGASLDVAWMLTGHLRQDDEWAYYPHAGLLPVAAGAIELAARAERLWVSFGARDVPEAGAWGAAVALRWWVNRWAAVSVAAYAHWYDRAPLEAPEVTASQALLLRGTVRMP